MRTAAITVALAALCASALLMSPEAVSAQCMVCEEKMDPGFNYWIHRFPPQAPPGDDYYDGDHEDWSYGPCGFHHSPCLAEGGQAVDFETLLDDPEALAAAVATNPALVFNVERQAVQLLSCRGTVLAHIPVELGRGGGFTAIAP